jgi:hypothetical protein
MYLKQKMKITYPDPYQEGVYVRKKVNYPTCVDCQVILDYALEHATVKNGRFLKTKRGKHKLFYVWSGPMEKPHTSLKEHVKRWGLTLNEHGDVE